MWIVKAICRKSIAQLLNASHIMALLHLVGSTVRTRNECYSTMFVLCYFYVLLVSAKCVRVRWCSLQMHSCESLISLTFCWTGDLAIVNICCCCIICQCTYIVWQALIYQHVSSSHPISPTICFKMLFLNNKMHLL